MAENRRPCLTFLQRKMLPRVHSGPVNFAFQSSLFSLYSACARASVVAVRLHSSCHRSGDGPSQPDFRTQLEAPEPSPSPPQLLHVSRGLGVSVQPWRAAYPVRGSCLRLPRKLLSDCHWLRGPEPCCWAAFLWGRRT